MTRENLQTFIPISVSSKFSICGLPIRVDTYTTCGFGCKYCFSNNREIMSPTEQFKIADLNALRRIIEKVETHSFKDADFLSKLISLGYTWHCGGMSDPFQPIEKELKVTEELVDIANEHNIHILYSTKSDTVYKSNIRPDTASFQLSITNLDNRTDLEPNVPSIDKRKEFFNYLKKNGFKVGIRIQPFIPGITTLDIVKEFEDADNFTLEGLKLVPQNQAHKEYLLKLLNLTPEYFMQMGLLNLLPGVREDCYKPFIEYFKSHNIPFSIADNDMHNIGTNLCCCGDRLVRKATPFNSTYLAKTYGKWTKEQVFSEIDKCGLCKCRCEWCFSSNRQEGCKTVEDFYNKRFDRESSTFSPEYIRDFSTQKTNETSLW